MQFEIPEQLSCPICMSIFKIPITTECGHSFCRTCLINSAKNKKVCPICRQQFQNSPQKLRQDQVLSLILQDFLSLSVHKSKKQDSSVQSKIQSMLLIEIKTNKLLLPYNKIVASFELPNSILLNSLLNRREKFVALQQAPFDKYGVVSRIVSLNKLRYNVYECILEGKSFCKIQDIKKQQGLSEMQQQFYYSTCQVKQIVQTSDVNPKQFTSFLKKFRQIKNPKILNSIQKQIDHNVFQHATDPLAMIYSIFGILAMQNQQKYRIITQFDQQKRIQQIKKFVSKITKDISLDVSGFLQLQKDTNVNYGTVAFLLVLFIIIYVINKSSSGEL